MTIEFTFTQADINTDPPYVVLEREEDDVLYLCRINARVSDNTNINGTGNMWLSWHDDESFAHNPVQFRQQLIQIPMGIYAQGAGKLFTYDFQMRLTNPGKLEAAIYDIYENFSITFKLDLVRLELEP